MEVASRIKKGIGCPRFVYAEGPSMLVTLDKSFDIGG